MTLPITLAVDSFVNVDPRAVEQSLYWIPLIPMLAALFNACFGNKLGKSNIAFIGCASVGASFLLSILCFACVYNDENTALYQSVFTWFAVPHGIHVDLAYAVDRLTGILLLIITGVGFLIHIYSVSYMHDERDVNFARYFAYLNLFVGMMLTLVMGANLVVLFVGWEGVGLASYLLIGFWWEDEAKAAAGRKAFVVNRIGDFGFLIGIFTLLATVGTVDLLRVERDPQGVTIVHKPLLEGVAAAIGQRPRMAGETPTLTLEALEAAHVRSGAFGPSDPRNPTSLGASWYFVVTLAVLLLFIGACGKSAQLPLYVWLPDAMAGPTPVSALIHAATMVTAGVYMLCRVNYLVGASPAAMVVIAFVGAATALFAAILGTQQDDIKKVLAYSTVSQLGYMILGCGIGAFWASSLHLVTHAFFKACLFLGAGSVMHAMANETNIKKLGGLRKDIPLTHWTFLIATIAITGVVPLSGFFSKDAILDVAEHSHWPFGDLIPWLLWGMGTLGAGFTAYYMFRAYFLTFWGERRSLKDHHAHEAGLMTGPLVVLAFMSILALVWGVPLHKGHTIWQEYLNPVFESGQNAIAARLHETGEAEEALPWIWWGIAIVVAWVGAGISYMFWFQVGPEVVAQRPSNPLTSFVANKFYVDELYDVVFVQPVKFGSEALWKIVDQGLIDGVLVGVWGFATNVTASILRAVQNGSAQRYAAVMAIAIAIILFASPARDYVAHLFGAH